MKKDETLGCTSAQVALAGVLTVGRLGLSQILCRAESTVKRQESDAPERLPAWVEGTKPRIWQLETVKHWMSQRDSAGAAKYRVPKLEPMIQPSKRGPGRPRKFAQGVSS
jgi:hypothetical protein